jgi:hypothetical protein
MKIKFIRNIVIGLSLSINLFLSITLFTPFTWMLFKPVIVDETVEKSKVIVVLTPGIPKKR